MHHTDAELDGLEELFLAQPVENEGMLLSEFDGFCAGLIVCPEMIPPSEWLSLVWGEDAAPSFPSLEAYQSALDQVMAHYNRVVRSLSPPSSGFLPVLDVDPMSGETLWEFWIEGFERAMALRPESWEAIVESDDEEAAASISLILVLYQISKGTSELEETAVDELEAKAPDLIPPLVEALNAWTKSRRGASAQPTSANLNWTPGTGRKAGRNEPCPWVPAGNTSDAAAPTEDRAGRAAPDSQAA